MYPKNPGITTVPGFFHVIFFSGNKKIFKHCGRDLNYRSSVLQAGFAIYFADPAFFVCLFYEFSVNSAVSPKYGEAGFLCERDWEVI